MATRATTANFSVSGSKPQALMAHAVAKEYEVIGYSSRDFLDKHTGLEFDLGELKRAFKVHCPDYMEPIVADVKSKAIEFCSKVIYEVGPESRKVKKGTGDKVWKFIFKNPTGDSYVFIATYKQENAEFRPESTKNTMILSLKQAALIVHDTLARLVELGCMNDKTLLTPLAGACFCKEDLKELCAELKMERAMLITSINQSTQGGGHYLTHSDIDIAICAGFAATKNVKDENLKKSIIVKLIKQYMTQGKIPNKDRIRIISKYATGGVPAEFSFENMSELINSEQRNFALIKLKKMEAETIMTSVVDTPTGSKGPQ
uniref:Nucleoprotein n=1 Tax=Hymenopteran phasma-related virus OKIAV234 TaxID=2792588 RepID=A0A7T0Q5U0_9VIRU|nr:nucleoprotein [Hymenopteran phasma-related virus OKIAV234]